MTALVPEVLPAGEVVPVEPITVTVERRNLTYDEAVEITERIRRTVNVIWLLMAEAHDRRADRALGYSSWAEYVQAEFKLSEAQSYNLLDVGRVMRAVVEVTGADPNALEPISVRSARRVKTNLAGLKRAIKAGLLHGGDLAEVIPMALEEVAPRADMGAKESNSPRQKTLICPCCMGTGRLPDTKRGQKLYDKAEAFMKRVVKSL